MAGIIRLKLIKVLLAYNFFSQPIITLKIQCMRKINFFIIGYNNKNTKGM